MYFGKNTPSLYFLLCKYSELWWTYLEGIPFLSVTCHIYPECWQNTYFDLFLLLMSGTCRTGMHGVCTKKYYGKHMSWAKMPPYYSTLKDLQVREFLCQKLATQEAVWKFLHSHGQSPLWITKVHAHIIPQTELPSSGTHPLCQENTASHHHISSADTHPQVFHKWSMSNDWEMLACILKHKIMTCLSWTGL